MNRKIHMGLALAAALVVGCDARGFGGEELSGTIGGASRDENVLYVVKADDTADVSGTYTLQGSDSLTVAESGTLTITGGNKFQTNEHAEMRVDGTVDNTGTLHNSGTLTFGKDANYIGDGGLLENRSKLYLDAEMDADALQRIATALDGSNVAKVYIEGDLQGVGNLDFGHVQSGSFYLEGPTSTGALDNDIDFGMAYLYIQGEGSMFNGSLNAGRIYVTGEDTIFNKNLVGNLYIQANAGIGASGIVSGGNMDIGDGYTLTNLGSIQFAGGAAFTGDGMLDNEKGWLIINTGMAAGSLENIARALGTEHVGTVQIDGALDNAGGLDFGGAGDGTFVFADTKTTGADYEIDLNNAKLITSGDGSYYGGKITAREITVAGQGTTFDNQVAADLVIEKASTIGADGSVIDRDIALSGGDLTNQGIVSLGDGNELSGTGSLINHNKLTLKEGMIFSGADGMKIVGNDGALEYDSNLNLRELLAHTQLNDGKLVFIGSNSAIDVDLALSGDTTGGLVETGAITSFKGLNVGAAKLAITDATVFDGKVKSENTAKDAILASAATTFKNAVEGNLTAAEAVTFSGAASGFSGGHLTLRADSVNLGGTVRIDEDKTFDLSADFDNQGKLTFDEKAAFTADSETKRYIDNNAGGVITASVRMDDLAALAGSARLNGGQSTFNLTSTGNYTLNKNLDFAGIQSGSRINFVNTDTGGLLTLGKNYAFAGADVHVGQGAVALGSGLSLTAGTFGVDAGASFQYYGVGNFGTINASRSTIAGEVYVADADSRLHFNGNLDFAANSTIRLGASEQSIARVHTTNGGKMTLGANTGIIITGYTADVAKHYGKAVLVADGDVNVIAGFANLTSKTSLYVYEQLEDGNIYVKDINKIEDLDPGNNNAEGNNPGGNNPDDNNLGNNNPGGNNPGDNNPGDNNHGGIPGDDYEDNGSGNSNTGGAGNPERSINKVNGDQYVNTILDRGTGGVNDKLAEHIQDLLNRVGGNWTRAKGQMYGEYGGAASDAALLSNELFFKTLYQQMDLNLNHQSGGYVLSGLPFGSDNALANAADAYPPTRREGVCFDYREKPGNLWGAAIGGWSRQRQRDGIYGYDNDSYGLVLGYDRQYGKFNFGFAASYIRGRTDVDDLATRFDSDLLNLGLYGSYFTENGLFVKAGLGYGHGWNEYDVHMFAGGKKEGSYKNDAFSANTEAGLVMCLGGQANLIPSVGVRYVHLRQRGWSEKLTGGITNLANWFAKEHYNSVEIPLAVRLNTVLRVGNALLAPEVRAGYVFAATHNRSYITTGFVGESFGATMYGVNPGRNRYSFGAGVKARISPTVSASVDYNLEFRNRYHHQNVMLSVGATF